MSVLPEDKQRLGPPRSIPSQRDVKQSPRSTLACYYDRGAPFRVAHGCFGGKVYDNLLESLVLTACRALLRAVLVVLPAENVIPYPVTYSATHSMQNENTTVIAARPLHCQIVPHLLLRELAERGLYSPCAFDLARLELCLAGHSDDADIDRLLRHVPFETLFESEKRSMDRVFQADVVVVAAREGR